MIWVTYKTRESRFEVIKGMEVIAVNVAAML